MGEPQMCRLRIRDSIGQGKYLSQVNFIFAYYMQIQLLEYPYNSLPVMATDDKYVILWYVTVTIPATEQVGGEGHLIVGGIPEAGGGGGPGFLFTVLAHHIYFVCSTFIYFLPGDVEVKGRRASTKQVSHSKQEREGKGREG
ncbi:hypothetical protein HOY80DRAFT_243133 [Tuber brumale]|nr:hypothetical protein HOY80DRAFT_243133 [Tuber brumale]